MVRRRIDQIPIRERNGQVENGADNAVPRTGCEVSIHPLPTLDGLIVKVIPPTQPVDGHLNHVPCDIVLVVDVSGSMSAPAPAPPREKGQKTEQTGLMVLDLAKHAANTIIKSLDNRDRLAIATFSQQCKVNNIFFLFITSKTNEPNKFFELEQVLLELVSMNPENKELAMKMINGMKPESTTHMLDGIQLGFQLFQDNSEDHQGNVPAMILLGDGRPEGGVGAIPSDGHIPAMRRFGKLPAPIHTFGFGYNLQPGLLQSIAELSGGNYTFISDPSMLGTVFIHAVANLQSTFARQAILNLTYPSIVGLEEMGIYINKRKPMSIESGNAMEYTINLNTLQYGQSREYYLRYTCRPEVLTNVMADGRPLRTVQATLQYQHGKDIYQEKALARPLGFDFTSLPDSEIAYHVSRAQVVGFLSNLFPLDRQGEHKPLRNDRISSCWKDLQALIKNLPAKQTEHFGDQRNRALVEDLIGNNIEDGEIELALRQQQDWEKWGQHFLPSLAGAHARQVRMSFMNPGTQVYGADSPLFLKRLDVLNEAFDRSKLIRPSSLPPSYSEAMAQAPEPVVDMSRYNNPRGTCFAGQTRVMLAPRSDEKDKKTITIVKLRAGMTVQTLSGPRTVRTVLKCHTDPEVGRHIGRRLIGDGVASGVGGQRENLEIPG
jgi:hypothetical protein